MTMRIMMLAGAATLALGGCGASTPADDATPGAMGSEAMAVDTGMPASGMAMDTGTAMGTGAAMAGAMPAASTPAMTAADFVAAAAASDTFEVASSKLAIARSKDSAVTGFARMMVTDHAKSTAALKKAAAQSSPAVAVAPTMTAEQTDNMAKLKAAGAGEFDAMYDRMQVAGHEKTLAAMQGYAASGDAAPLKAFAATTAPVVSGHLDKARQLPQ